MLWARRLRDVEMLVARLDERQEANDRLRAFLLEDISRRIEASTGRFVDAKVYEERHDELLVELQKVRAEMSDVQANDRATRRSVVTMITVAAVALPSLFFLVEFVR